MVPEIQKKPYQVSKMALQYFQTSPNNDVQYELRRSKCKIKTLGRVPSFMSVVSADYNYPD